MRAKEIPLVFGCRGEKLVGIIHHAEGGSKIGVLLVVGGPQYRVGSHRQFVLLARHLASQGIPVMRFDVRGMGDSEGEQRSFADLDDDIAAAVDCLLTSCPELDGVVLWGLCDAASAALFYGYQDSRVKGMVLLNPWVFTEQGAAKTVLKHYYLRRLLSKDFWLKIIAFKFDYAHSLASLFNLLKQASAKNETSKTIEASVKVDENLALPIRMRECFRRFTAPVLLILSGRDLTADEFKETVKGDPEWQTLINDSRVTRRDFNEADHTFSSEAWREQVARWTSDWINTLDRQ
ncbi:MAG: hydrolase 1, exosortase A system-associated [Methylomonas sp.]|nr:hydrolase 1, exosortase A system-associated [Methylomonas sp.]